jgi:hypothetical protein
LSCDDGLVLRSPAEPGAAPKAIPAFWRVVRTAELIAEPGSKRKRLCEGGQDSPFSYFILFLVYTSRHLFFVSVPMSPWEQKATWRESESVKIKKK